MAQVVALEICATLKYLGKRVRGMFIRVSGKAAQGLELSGCIEPKTDCSAVFRPPGFDGERKLRSPHEQRRKNGKPRIQSRIQPFDAQDEAPNRFRCGPAVCV